MKSFYTVVGKQLLVLVLIATPTAVAHAQVYKIIDEDGNVSYTNVPPEYREDATVVEGIPETYDTEEASPAPKLPDPPIEKADTSDKEYEKIAIVSPTNDGTLRANNGNIVLQASLVPPLRLGHTMRFYLDNQPVGKASRTELALTNVERGTHSLWVTVLGRNEEVLKRSESLIFHVQRTSALGPTRKPAPSRPQPRN